MDRQRDQKQRYLRQNILDREYDAQQFMDFCQSYKGSIDIDSWSLNELKQIVQKFISSSSKTIQLNPFDYNNSKIAKVQSFDWDQAFNQAQKHQDKQLNLNLVDLDFLETMGMAPSKTKIEHKPAPIASRQQKKEEKPIVTDPATLLAKLNDKSNEFISAYNARAINNREENKQRSKEEVSPTIKRNKQTTQVVPQNDVLIPTVKDNVIIDENFKTTVKCRTFSNKPKLDAEYQIVVSGHEVINPNPFVPNFVLYSITTNPLGIQVKRRLKDFQTLRALLKKIFPATQIPFLERYGRRLSETEPTVIRKQKLFLQSFLNGLMMNKNIRCKIIDDFLLCENLDTLKKIFRDFQKLEKPKGIQDLYTIGGKVQVQYNAQNKKYVAQQQLYFDYLENNMEKIKELYDQLSVSLLNSVRIIGQITDLYDNLRTSTKNINNLLNQSLKSNYMEQTFDKISDLHKHWALSMKSQAKILQIQVRHLYRYEGANIETIRQVCKNSDALSEAYSKRGDKAQAAREQYEFNKRLSDYKIGIETASKNTTVLRYQAGFFLQNSVSQIRRYITELSTKMTKKFKLFSGLQLNICGDLQKNWHQFQAYANVNYK